MRSFRLYVGHRSRLTAAGWLVLLLSAATTVALGLAGGIWGVSRLSPGASGIALFLVTAGAGATVWSAGAGFCRLAGLPRITPEGHGWGRRPVQFTLGWLQLVIFVVAVLCAVIRLAVTPLDRDWDLRLGKVIYFGSMLVVITWGTAGVVLHRGTTSLRGGMVCGGLAGSCLSAVCLGWMFVLLWVIESGIGPLLVLAAVTVMGGLLGMLIGLATVVWQRGRSGGRCKAFIRRPHGL
jgi:hypothetical protein